MNRLTVFTFPAVILIALLCLATPSLAARIWVCGDLEKVSPRTGSLIHTSWSSYKSDTLYQKSNFHWNGSSRTVLLEGARGEVLGFQVIIDRQEDELSNVHLSLGNLEGPGTLDVSGNHRIFRTCYITNTYSGVLVPLDKATDWDYFPVPDNTWLGFSNKTQAVWIDIAVPPETLPGTYQGILTISADQFAEPKILNVQLKVWNITLPEELNYDVELNNYGNMWRNFDWAKDYAPWEDNGENKDFLNSLTEEQKADYLVFERNAYKVCHNNRLTLNTMPYFQYGDASTILPESMTPVFAGSGEDFHVADWNAFDERWGPLFDGSAFTGCYRAGVPAAHHYLPYCHNIPSNFDNFIADQTDPPYWGKNPVYEAENIAFARAFEEHANEHGWTRTLFQVFYNEKQSMSPRIIWHLDEPIDTIIGKEYGDRKWIEYTWGGQTKQVLRGSYDYDAQLYYSRLMHAGFSNTLHPGQTLGDPAAQAAFPYPEQARFVYRIDIGRQNLSQVVAGVLDGYIDQWMVGGYYDLPSLWQRVDKGEIYTAYGNWGTTPKVNNCFFTLTAWNNYRNRSTGHEIWMINGQWSDLLSSWKNGSGNTTLLYPGSTIGIDEPCASFRIKSLRHGAQDYEYLLLLKGLQPGRDMEILTSFLNETDSKPDSEFRGKKLSPETFYLKKREIAHAILGASGHLVPAEGDLDGNGLLEINDVIRLAIYLLWGRGDESLDFNGDGELGMADVIALIIKIR
ncbi:MAG: DUF4091 domain-containing protein, partial [Gemmatimonadota bacterium]|nr:DUF4091 domain-containing protein [Gemmatimonadota bacterium]